MSPESQFKKYVSENSLEISIVTKISVVTAEKCWFVTDHHASEMALKEGKMWIKLEKLETIFSLLKQSEILRSSSFFLFLSLWDCYWISHARWSQDIQLVFTSSG